MKLFRRASAIIFAALIISAVFCSCSKKAETITSENAAKITAPLMEGAEKCYGYIMLGQLEPQAYDYDAVTPDSGNGMKYVPVADKNLNTLQKLKAEAEKYYTVDFAQANYYSSAFEGEYPIYKEINGELCINVDGGGGGGYTYIPSTSKLVSSDDSGAVVAMDCNDNYGGLYAVTVTLKLVDGQYRIDNLEYSD